MFAHSFDPTLVGKFASTQNEFLQVLLDRFRILRTGNGFELRVAFADESPCIWKREARKHILEKLHPTRRAEVQSRIDEFLNSEKTEFDYHDSGFPFRLGNGGTLPVVRWKGADYYCFFYREAPPTGWNIANGGANSLHDLLHPDAVVERELREELIIVEPERRRWYVFDWHDARLRDHPDFADAQMLWRNRFSEQGYKEFEVFPLPLKWSFPPDRGEAESPISEERYHDTVQVLYGKETVTRTGKGFLNINAEDFGIEFDRIAKLSVGPDAVFCDGELRNGRLLNRVVGLFEVNRVQDAVAANCGNFRPERVFWNGVDRTGDPIEDVIEGYLLQRHSSWARFLEEFKSRPGAKPTDNPLNLCPVTRTIVERHRRLRAVKQPDPPSSPDGRQFEAFVSFASEDHQLARKVYDQITASSCRAFFSDVTMTAGGFADQIDHALDSATAFVAVGSRAEHLQKSWVKYEWRNFHNDMNAGRKPKKAPFFAFISGVNPNDLPRPLRMQQAVVANGLKLASALKKVTQYISTR